MENSKIKRLLKLTDLGANFTVLSILELTDPQSEGTLFSIISKQKGENFKFIYSEEVNEALLFKDEANAQKVIKHFRTISKSIK
jgi:hypothetical protein